MLRKGFYPYEYIDSWEGFDETLLPNKNAFYSKLNLENITDKDYEHAHKVWEVFGIKILGCIMTYMFKADILLLADVFEHFKDICIEIYELDPAHFFCTVISMASLLKKDNSKSRIINRY